MHTHTHTQDEAIRGRERGTLEVGRNSAFLTSLLSLSLYFNFWARSFNTLQRGRLQTIRPIFPLYIPPSPVNHLAGIYPPSDVCVCVCVVVVYWNASPHPTFTSAHS